MKGQGMGMEKGNICTEAEHICCPICGRDVSEFGEENTYSDTYSYEYPEVCGGNCNECHNRIVLTDEEYSTGLYGYGNFRYYLLYLVETYFLLVLTCVLPFVLAGYIITGTFWFGTIISFALPVLFMTFDIGTSFDEWKRKKYYNSLN